MKLFTLNADAKEVMVTPGIKGCLSEDGRGRSENIGWFDDFSFNIHVSEKQKHGPCLMLNGYFPKTFNDKDLTIINRDLMKGMDSYDGIGYVAIPKAIVIPMANLEDVPCPKNHKGLSIFDTYEHDGKTLCRVCNTVVMTSKEGKQRLGYGDCDSYHYKEGIVSKFTTDEEAKKSLMRKEKEFRPFINNSDEVISELFLHEGDSVRVLVVVPDGKLYGLHAHSILCGEAIYLPTDFHYHMVDIVYSDGIVWVKALSPKEEYL